MMRPSERNKTDTGMLGLPVLPTKKRDIIHAREVIRCRRQYFAHSVKCLPASSKQLWYIFSDFCECLALKQTYEKHRIPMHQSSFVTHGEVFTGRPPHACLMSVSVQQKKH